MSNENLNNTPNWKQKLDSLGSLPGEEVRDKNALWEKLHERFDGKRRKKQSAWYWAAAACVAFALMISLFFSNRNNQQSNTSIVKANQASKETFSAKVEKKDFAPVRNSAVAINKEKSQTTSRQIVAKRIERNEENKLRLTQSASSKNLLPGMQSNFITPMDTLSSLVIIQPETKKLKVVHINELGDPVETLPEIVRNSDKHTFQFKIASQEIYINPTTASNTNGFTILKIKPSQN
jgi:hypothetical protein